jgi:hypothetical protein
MASNRFARVLLATVIGVFATLVTTGPAQAAVVVPPGGSGHTCSGYQVINSNVKWQTCAWADNNEVYFTVNFANSGGSTFIADGAVLIDYIRSGTKILCAEGVVLAFQVPPHSTKGTPTALCARPRTRAAYASVGEVRHGARPWASRTSPTLQVQ